MSTRRVKRTSELNSVLNSSGRGGQLQIKNIFSIPVPAFVLVISMKYVYLKIMKSVTLCFDSSSTELCFRLIKIKSLHLLAGFSW